MMGTFTNTGWAYYLGDGFRSFLEIVLGHHADNISFVHFLAQAMKSVPMGITHFSGGFLSSYVSGWVHYSLKQIGFFLHWYCEWVGHDNDDRGFPLCDGMYMGSESAMRLMSRS